jgi:hypothetical protein
MARSEKSGRAFLFLRLTRSREDEVLGRELYT